jgi:hypothetical protein
MKKENKKENRLPNFHNSQKPYNPADLYKYKIKRPILLTSFITLFALLFITLIFLFSASDLGLIQFSPGDQISNYNIFPVIVITVTAILIIAYIIVIKNSDK